MNMSELKGFEVCNKKHVVNHSLSICKTRRNSLYNTRSGV